MRFSPQEINQLLTLTDPNHEAPIGGSPDWALFSASERLFKDKLLRILWDPCVGIGSLRDVKGRELKRDDLLTPEERRARAQALLRQATFQVEGPRGASRHQFEMLTPARMGNLSCLESIVHEDHEFTRIWSRFGTELGDDYDPSRKWVHKLSWMTAPSPMGQPDRLISVGHATGWITSREQNTPNESTQWVDDLSDSRGSIHAQRGQSDITRMVLPERGGEVLVVSEDAHGLIKGVEWFGSNGQELGRVEIR